MAAVREVARRFVLRIRTQAVLLSAVPLAFLIALFAVAGVLQSKSEQIAAASQRSSDALDASEAITKAVSDANDAAVEYDRRPNPALLVRYRGAIGELPAQLTTLAWITANQPEQYPRAARFSAVTVRVVREVLDPFVARLQSDRAHAMARAQVPATRRLAQAWVEARTDFELSERRTAGARYAALHRDISILGPALIAISIAGIVVTVAVTGQFGLRIARRLVRLAENARRLGTGEPTQPLGGGDEIADLDRVYHAMTRRVQESLHEKEEALAAYERAQHVATTLQRALLPQALPSLPGMVFDSVYVPGRMEAQVGGDWYDAVRLSDGRVLLAIGDVAGSGLQAAIIMAAMREVIRGVAHVYADPPTIVDAADRTLKSEHPDRLVTAIVAVFDPVARTLTYCSAGHPSPLMRLIDGSVRELAARGLPLGLRARDEASTQTITVPDGALILLYTDGVTESTQDVIEGERRLRAALADASLAGDAHPARALHDALLADGAHDDVAILAMRLDAVADQRHTRTWRFDSADAATAQRARAAFAALLANRMPAEDVFTAELIFGELLSNVVRYAPGDIEVVLDWSDVSAPTLHVLDRGSGFVLIPRLPSDLLSERGRGLFLVWSLSEDFNVTKRDGGGSHVRVVLFRRAAAASGNGRTRAEAIAGSGA